MSLLNDDLDDYVEKFRNIFYKQNCHNVNQSDLWSLIDNLTKELELSKEREECLQRNLSRYLESENVDITSKFVSLTEKYEIIDKENVDLKGRLEDLQVQMATEVNRQKKKFSGNLTELEERYKSEIIQLKEQMESDKIRYEAKEKQLYDELQVTQASTALQCDEIESNLKRQLFDANTKLRNSQNIIRSLQMDINSLKNQLASQQQTPAYSKPLKPEIRFQPLPITSTKSQNLSINYDELEPDDTDFFETPSFRSPTPLVTPLRENDLRQANTPTVFRGGNRDPKQAETTPAGKTKKKRKLYDAKSFDESNFQIL